MIAPSTKPTSEVQQRRGRNQRCLSRRRFLQLASAGLALGAAGFATATGPKRDKALIAITLDLEMSRTFPQWEMTHWDYQKGNLDDAAKRYTVEACRRVKERGGVLHCFAVGQVFEQENVDWLKGIVEAGHPVGNHTYDHVNVTATRPEDVQFRFQRAPWLLRGMTARQAVEENIRLADMAIKTRLGVKSAGFRTPGGFANGLADHPDLQQLFLDLGFKWISSKYPKHAMSLAGQAPNQAIFDSIVTAQDAAQPFVYHSGLIEVPMSPVSDIGAFRNGRWKLDYFLDVTKKAVARAIETRAVFDFTAHPSCLGIVDPQFKTIDLICDLVEKSNGRAQIVDLATIARSVK